MRILFVTDYLAPQLNGIAIRCENYIKYLREMGHEVKVYGPATCPTTDVPMMAMQNMFNKENSLCVGSLKLLKDVGSKKFDIVHLIWSPFFMLPVLALARAKHVKVFVSNHVNLNMYGDQYMAEHKILKAFASFVILETSIKPQRSLQARILAPSHGTVPKQLHPYVEIIPSGVDIDTFSYCQAPPESKILLSIGRIAPEKNMQELLTQFLALQDKTYRLIVVGDGPQKAMMESKFSHPRITFVGAVDHDQVPAFYQKAQAFLSFSKSETFGFTLLESLSCGTPFICFDTPPFDSLYKSEFPESMMTPSRSFEDCVNYTLQGGQKLREKCRAYAETKSWRKATEELALLYSS